MVNATVETVSVLESMLLYATLGWKVFPACTPGDDGQCTFHQRECHPGKNPRIRKWQKLATTKAATIEAWCQQWPDMNIGIATGHGSGVVVLDIDPRHRGNETLDDLEAQYGCLPETVMAISGSGGRHYYFKTPACPLRGGQNALGEGIDVQADGLLIIAAPSLHVSGRRYEWEATSHPSETVLAELPDWIVHLINDRAPRSMKIGDVTTFPQILAKWAVHDFPLSRNPKRPILPNPQRFTTRYTDAVTIEEENEISSQMPHLDLPDFASLKYDPQAEYFRAHRALHLPITKVLRPSEGTSNFRCPLDHDRKPSASLYCANNGGYVLREWHGPEADAKHRGLYYTLPEVLASQAYGAKVHLGTTPEHLVWRLKLDYLAGLLEPVDVSHVDLPATIYPFIQMVYAGFQLLLGLKWTHTHGEPTTFARKFAAAWCGVTERQYSIAMKHLLGQRYLVKGERFEGAHKNYSTFTIGEGPQDGEERA